MIRTLTIMITASMLAGGLSADEQWRRVYSESFDRLPPGTKTGSKDLHNWEAFSAAGVVFDGKMESTGRFLVADAAWTSFNQGPIFNLDLSPTPHDRVRVRFDLYTFGIWRGMQAATGGPQHRLMFFDNKAHAAFVFDTNFSTHEDFAQSWPQRNPSTNKALTGARPIDVDATGRFSMAHRWPIEFEYSSDSPSLRFAILCGAAAGSGEPMPQFGIDNVEVYVRSTAPTISPVDRPDDVRLAEIDPLRQGMRIEFSVPVEGRSSIGIFDRDSGRLLRTLLSGEALPRGRHSVVWDGLDNRGKPLAAGSYEWRALTSPGFTARYITTIGINPPGGEHPTPRRSWVGDHSGAGIVDVDGEGVYVGSPMTEGLMMLAKVDSARSRVIWTREQFYQGGRLTRAAASGVHVFMLHPNGTLRRLNKDNGRVEMEWSIGETAVDMDARGQNLVVADGSGNKLTWLSVETGQELTFAPLENPTCLAVLEANEKGAVVAASGTDIHHIQPGHPARRVATLSGAVGAMDYDASRKELWAVVNGHQVVRMDDRFQVAQTYSDRPREYGPFDPSRFAGVYDIAADLQGGFFIGEPGHPPRRIAHVARDGSVIEQWFGGMSFYVSGTFDPEEPSRLYGIAPEGAVNVYRIDFDRGTWQLEEVYSAGRLGDSIFPHAASFQAVRRNGQLYLYHRVIPAVLRLDPNQRCVVPVAAAGRVLNHGRSFFQFAGSGRDGYPIPWVAAAEHHGYQDLSKAPALYSWADTNDNGDFDPDEFQFYPHATHGLSFHNVGDFASNGDYIGTSNTNEPHALIRLPVSAWEGPRKDAPRWDWSRVETVGEIIADSYGYGSPRGVSLGPDGSAYVAYQAGIMIREHGQYEGGGWPEAALRGARLLGFDSQFKPTFAVGRQSKDGLEANRGVLYYPMQTTTGPNRTVIVNDQTKQPAQVWTHDGLYVGGFFDGRANDGLDDGFYRIHGDDNQGGAVVTDSSGKTYWLMPYQGHNRLYEITGWHEWERQSGDISLPRSWAVVASRGSGLTARYYCGNQLVLETTEDPIYFERFGAERHSKIVTPHYKVEWTGFVAPPVTDRYRFAALLGKAEQVAVWIDGRIVFAKGFPTADVIRPVDLAACHPHRIRIEYINPEGRAELKLLWTGRVVDPTRLGLGSLHAKSWSN